MKKILIFFLFLVSIKEGFSQVPNTDTMLPKIAAEKNDSIRARLVWHCLGTSETDPVLDLQIAEKLLVQSRKNKDPIEEVISLACLGYDYRLLGDNARSWKYNLEAFSVAEQNPNEEAKSLAHHTLAQNYEDNGDYSKATELFSKAIEYAAKTKYDEALSVYLLSFGEFYLNTNKIDSALIQTQRSYELSMRIGYRDYLGAILQQLGSIHARLGNSALAISYYNLAIQEGYKMKSPRFISSSFMAIAQYYIDAKQKDSAIVYAKKAIHAIQNTAFSNMAIYPAKLLLDMYRNTSVDSAFKYSEIYRSANDSLFNAKTIQQTQLLAFEENVRQQQVAEEKVKENEQRQQNIQYVLIAFCIIIFITLFLLLSRTVIVNERLISFFAILGLLVVFEFINLVIHPRLASFTHESPVLMLLALVVIASLLIPLHHRLEHWIKEKMVEKNKAIRLAAAKKTIERLEKKSENV